MFDNPNISRKKIAVIGAGISGLSSAYYLSKHHDVTLFEAENRLGGHARTKVAGINGDQPVDTGFIVFNFATYPYLTRLFNFSEIMDCWRVVKRMNGGRLMVAVANMCHVSKRHF